MTLSSSWRILGATLVATGYARQFVRQNAAGFGTKLYLSEI